MKKIFLIYCLLMAGCAHLNGRTLPNLDNTCPEDFPIKGNDGENGWIYHTNESTFYEKTNPEWCFADEDAAVNFGYRKSKSNQWWR